MKLGKSTGLGKGTLALLLARVRALKPLPSLAGRNASAALLDTNDTRIGQAVATLAGAHPGQAGIYFLRNGPDAFATRLLLAAHAERSLDIQYYIWRGDRTGTLLFDALRAAADRGVRVRLLLDDNNTWALDSWLAAIDSHERIEVRLFNPFVLRRPRFIGYLTDFFRLNRRMHNKSFTADSQATIIGGRNIGDEYFDAVSDTPAYVDLDALAIGPVVRDVSNDFDRYWASASAYPAQRLLPRPASGTLERLRTAAAAIEHAPGATEYLCALRTSTVVGGTRRWHVAVRVGADTDGQRRPGERPRSRSGRTTVPGAALRDHRQPCARARARVAVLRADGCGRRFASCALRAGVCAFAFSSTRSRPRT